MTRTRAVGLIGLVLGLSGCAGTQHHHHHHAAAQPGIPVAPPATVAFGTDCGCATHAHVPAPVPTLHQAPAPSRIAQQARPATVVATTATRPGPPSTSSVPPSSRPVAVPAPPPSSRPIAVPAPAGVVRYLPMFDDPGTIVRSAWDSPPPDFLGVRTALASGPPMAEFPEAPGDLDLAPPGHLPMNSAPLPPTPSMPPVWNASPLPSTLPSPPVPDKVIPMRWGQLEPRSDVVPASVVVNVAETGSAGRAASPATSVPAQQRPRTVALESGTPAASLAGRPRWDPAAATTLPPQDPGGSSSWVSQLALTPSPSQVAADRVEPTPRDVVPAGRDSVVSRFVRRVRGAGRAFLEPELLR